VLLSAKNKYQDLLDELAKSQRELDRASGAT
jgi:hypothetical protein